MSHAHASRLTRTALAGIGTALALVALSACSDTDTGADKDKDKGKAASSKPADPGTGGTAGTGGKSPEKKEEPKKAVAFKGNGTFEVGKDLKPGTYRTTGNGSTAGCYWELTKDSSGEADSIIANDNVTGASYMTVKAPAKILKSSDCKDWEVVDEKAAGSPKSAIKGDGGMFKVGVDIAPGTYKSAGPAEGSAGCYWERAKDAAHGLDSIAANDNPTGPAVVTVSAKDAYFKTTGCGDWKKSG
ncbi:hypothetical protein [Streptomyces sp. NPDC089799]|uniref:hypothetical protein n=1 Tax=Streptomyces sp. NPDC089799 TaxID=3155066 RepID=UPI00343AD546